MKTISATSVEAVLASRNLIAKDTYEIGFELEADFYFTPGQYIWLRLHNLSFPDPRGAQRAFSLCSSPQEKRIIRICFRTSESGFKRTLLSLPMRSTVFISGPFGGNFLLSEKNSNYVFIAGGTGVASFLSILRDEQTWESNRRITLLFANRSKESAPYREELEALSKEQKQFELHEVYGLVSDLAILGTQLGQNVPCCVSGPQGFVDAIYRLLMGKVTDASLIHFEENYPVDMSSGKSKYLKAFDPAQMAGLVLNETTNHIVFCCIEGLILYANPASQQGTGYTFEEMKGNTPRLWGGLMGHDFYERLWRTIKIEKKPFVDKVVNRKKSGVLYTALARISPIFDTDGALIGFISTEEDITEIERIDQAKTDFVSTASHQLRTPLSIIRWYTELLIGGDIEKPTKKQLELLNEILTGSHRMAALIDALLTVSRIELGTFAVEPKQTDIMALIKTIKEEYARDIASKRLLFTESYARSLPSMLIDPRVLQIIYSNLVSNAVKYTPEGGTIKLDVRTVEAGKKIGCKKILEKSLAVSVFDTGYGVPESQKHKIFTKFFRADNARNKVPDGSGLGLYIVKSLVEYIHGMVWFESEENKGTTFFVVVPLASTKQKKEGATLLLPKDI